MSPAGKARREHILGNKDLLKPRYCKKSSTKYCICKNLQDCSVIECGEGAVMPWEEV